MDRTPVGVHILYCVIYMIHKGEGPPPYPPGEECNPCPLMAVEEGSEDDTEVMDAPFSHACFPGGN